jgi:hypothetical protein
MRRGGVPLSPDERRALMATACGGCAWRAVPPTECAACGHAQPAVILLAGLCGLALCRFCEALVLISRRDAESRGTLLEPLCYLSGEPLPPVHLTRVHGAAQASVARRRAIREQRRQRQAARVGTPTSPPAPAAVA